MGGMIGDLISSGERIRENPPLKGGHDQIKCQEFQLIRVFGTDRWFFGSEGWFLPPRKVSRGVCSG
jgi:hypothetical protein